MWRSSWSMLDRQCEAVNCLTREIRSIALVWYNATPCSVQRITYAAYLAWAGTWQHRIRIQYLRIRNSGVPRPPARPLYLLGIPRRVQVVPPCDCGVRAPGCSMYLGSFLLVCCAKGMGATSLISFVLFFGIIITGVVASRPWPTFHPKAGQFSIRPGSSTQSTSSAADATTSSVCTRTDIHLLYPSVSL